MTSWREQGGRLETFADRRSSRDARDGVRPPPEAGLCDRPGRQGWRCPGGRRAPCLRCRDPGPRPARHGRDGRPARLAGTPRRRLAGVGPHRARPARGPDRRSQRRRRRLPAEALRPAGTGSADPRDPAPARRPAAERPAVRHPGLRPRVPRRHHRGRALQPDAARSCRPRRAAHRGEPHRGEGPPRRKALRQRRRGQRQRHRGDRFPAAAQARRFRGGGPHRDRPRHRLSPGRRPARRDPEPAPPPRLRPPWRPSRSCRRRRRSWRRSTPATRACPCRASWRSLTRTS